MPTSKEWKEHNDHMAHLDEMLREYGDEESLEGLGFEASMKNKYPNVSKERW